MLLPGLARSVLLLWTLLIPKCTNAQTCLYQWVCNNKDIVPTLQQPKAFAEDKEEGTIFRFVVVYNQDLVLDPAIEAAAFEEAANNDYDGCRSDNQHK